MTFPAVITTLLKLAVPLKVAVLLTVKVSAFTSCAITDAGEKVKSESTAIALSLNEVGILVLTCAC
ncbi:hypothetical protein PcPA57_00010 [Pasteurella canis]|nr:hypothetical protein PcPA57_00010 [Pasteurella canis]